MKKNLIVPAAAVVLGLVLFGFVFTQSASSHST